MSDSEIGWCLLSQNNEREKSFTRGIEIASSPTMDHNTREIRTSMDTKLIFYQLACLRLIVLGYLLPIPSFLFLLVGNL